MIYRDTSDPSQMLRIPAKSLPGTPSLHKNILHYVIQFRLGKSETPSQRANSPLLQPNQAIKVERIARLQAPMGNLRQGGLA